MAVAAPPLPEITPGLYGIATAAGAPAAGSPSAPTLLSSYFLTQQDPPAGASVTLESAWEADTLAGWFLFLVGAIESAKAKAFVKAARKRLPQISPSTTNPRTLVWLEAPDPTAVAAWIALYQPGGAGTPRTPVSRQQGPYAFNWQPLSLLIDSGVDIAFDPDAAALTLVTTPDANEAIQLVSAGRQSNWYGWYPEDDGAWAMTLPLAGAAPGAFRTRLAMDFGVLLADFSCGLRFFQEAVGGAVTALAFPFYPPLPLGQPMLGFALSLHPLVATDPDRSHVALDLVGASPANPFQAQSAALRGGYFLTPSGGAITLAPLPAVSPAASGLGPSGFAFCSAPDTAGSPTATSLYLCPIGAYEITGIDTAGGSPGAPGRWMCGLTGLEYLEVEIGDAIGLCGAMPARLPARSDDPSGGLDATYTTSWVEYPLGAATRRFFGQPSASVYFGSVPSGGFARPVQALLATLEAPARFPLAPYGGVTGVDAQILAAFEAKALTGERHAQLTVDSPGPVFLPPAPVGRASLLTADDGVPTTAETKQGFIVHLNDATSGEPGTWGAVDLALSPENPGQFLRLTGVGSPGVVPKPIASQLLRDELFLVVSDATALGQFANEIAIAGFTFRLDVGVASPVDSNSTILIFKYNTTTPLRTLATDRGLWAASDVFVRDPEGTHQQILEALAAAEASPVTDDPFANFREILADPGWTGMIALNCAIDGNAMPPDLQMLLGGINGQLRAHHFGIQGNTLASGPDGAEIAQSSLFGVIAYPSATQPLPPIDTTDDFAYELELLTVVFSNSTVQDLKVRVGLTINRLFGREVVLVSGPVSPQPVSPHNTLQIAGRYQLQDGIATVTFASDAPFFYEFPAPEGTSRVLRQVAFNRASLVPVSSTPLWSPSIGSPSPVAVTARFNLAGGVWFNPEPFAQAPGFDLFSFGAEPTSVMTNGLALDGLAVTIAFTLDGEGVIEGHASVTGDLAAVRLTGGQAAIRRDSLLDSLPLQLSKFLCVEAGFTAASVGASAVHVLQLEPAAVPGSPFPVSPSTGPPTPGPNVTIAPQFGLEFDMPLGSLGVLSSATVGLMAKLVIAWGASRLTPETDAAAVFVQLPQAFAGYGSFQLQGILKTVFGDANLLMVDLKTGERVYAVLFNNIQLSVLGKTFPPGLVIDFLIFSGRPPGSAGNDNNLAWFLGATDAKPSPTGTR